MDYMLDLETLGKSSNAVIISIGAVAFEPAKNAIITKFYSRVCPVSCQDSGLVIDADTVVFWLGQSAEARGAFINQQHKPPSLRDVLTSLSSWMEGFGKDRKVWGNGAVFDNVILANAYKALKLPVPWSYRDDRCYRTLRCLYPDVPMVDYGVAHNAVDDATAQALHLMRIWPKLRSA